MLFITAQMRTIMRMKRRKKIYLRRMKPLWSMLVPNTLKWVIELALHTAFRLFSSFALLPLYWFPLNLASMLGFTILCMLLDDLCSVKLIDSRWVVYVLSFPAMQRAPKLCMHVRMHFVLSAQSCQQWLYMHVSGFFLYHVLLTESVGLVCCT